MLKLEAYESKTSYFRCHLFEDEVYYNDIKEYVPHKAVQFLEKNPVVHLEELKQIVKLLEEFTP